MAESRKCPNCSAALKPAARFCTKCGAGFEPEAPACAPDPAQAGPGELGPGSSADPAAEPARARQEKSWKEKLADEGADPVDAAAAEPADAQKDTSWKEKLAVEREAAALQIKTRKRRRLRRFLVWCGVFVLASAAVSGGYFHVRKLLRPQYLKNCVQYETVKTARQSCIEELIELDEAEMLDYLDLARIYEGFGDRPSARSALDRGLAKYPESRPLYEERARLALDILDFDDAAFWAEAAYERTGTADVYLSLISRCVDSGSRLFRQSAHEYLARVDQISPNNSRTAELRGRLLIYEAEIGERDWAEVFLQLESALKNAPENRLIRNSLARAALQYTEMLLSGRARWREVIEVIDNVIAKVPNLDHTLLADLHRRKGIASLLNPHLRPILARGFRNPIDGEDRGLLFESIDLFRAALRHNPTDAESMIELARLYEAAWLWENAVDMYRAYINNAFVLIGPREDQIRQSMACLNLAITHEGFLRIPITDLTWIEVYNSLKRAVEAERQRRMEGMPVLANHEFVGKRVLWWGRVVDIRTIPEQGQVMIVNYESNPVGMYFAVIPNSVLVAPAGCVTHEYAINLYRPRNSRVLIDGILGAPVDYNRERLPGIMVLRLDPPEHGIPTPAVNLWRQEMVDRFRRETAPEEPEPAVEEPEPAPDHDAPDDDLL